MIGEPGVTRVAVVSGGGTGMRAAAAVDGTVDVLINNAGGVASRGMPDGGLTQVARAWEADYQSNVLSAVLLTEALLARARVSQ